MPAEPKAVQIGGYTYIIQQLPATKCVKWQARLGAVFAPIIKEAGESLNLQGDSLLDTQIDVNSVVKALTNGVAGLIGQIEKIDPKMTILFDLLELVTVRKDRTDEMQLTVACVNLHFGNGAHQAPVTDMYKVAYEVIKANHFLPIPDIGGLAKSLKQKTP
jgi:hypothetical protein